MLATQVLKSEHHSIGQMLTIVQKAGNIREDHLVFRMADAMLPAAEQNRLLSDFEAIEDARLGATARQSFEAMLDEMDETVAAWEHPLASPLSPLLTSVRIC